MGLDPFKSPASRTKGFQHFERGLEDEIGNAGETLFKRFLEQRGIFDYRWVRIHENYRSKTWTWDFKVRGYTIEIKTIDENPYKTRLLIPCFQNVDCDFYVGVKLPDAICGFLSKASKAEVFKLPIANFGHCRAYWKLLSELNPTGQLPFIQTYYDTHSP